MSHHHHGHNTHSDRPGSSGFGTVIALGTAALATVSMVAMLSAMSFTAPVIGAIVGGLGLLAGGLLVVQHHKEKVNEERVTRNYAATEGYHKEPEQVKDQSLIHLIHGRGDLPARVQYIEDNYGEYGVKPLSADQFRGKYMGYGLALGVAVAALTVIGVTAVAGAGMAALGFAGVMGSLLGGTALAMHTAHTMERYDAYVDGQAAEGRKRQQEAEAAPARSIEYDNGCERRRTFCEEVTASRQQQAASEACL